MENQIKHWMRVGLQDDKWIQLLPNTPKWHPWFNDDNTINSTAMANDAVEAFHAPEWKEQITQWASEVAQEKAPK